MTSVSRLDVYEIAYLCGGPERVAMAAVVAMQQDGRIRISPTRHRIQVVHRRASRPVERAVLDAVPASGTVLGPALRDIAKSGAVGQLIEELRGRGLIGQHAVLGHPHLSAAGRQARKEVEDSSATMRRERRVAVLGAAGITNAKLRAIFETPDPPPRRSLTAEPHKRNKRNKRKSGEPAPFDYSDSSLPEYPGVANRW